MGLINELVNGIQVGGIYIKGIADRGRFSEEYNVDLYSGTGVKLLTLKVFLGRGRYYGPWVEVFNVNESVWGAIDEWLIRQVASYLSPGSVIYVEYLTDRETAVQLQRGYPPALTRLGYLMLKVGFTWFKDWYYPEGWLEGGPKLEGQLPLNCLDAEEKWGRIRGEAEAFLRGWGGGDHYWVNAYSRARSIIEGSIRPSILDECR